MSSKVTCADLPSILLQGKWAGNDGDHVRNVKWACENMRAFVDKAKGRPFEAVIEHVRDGSTVRCFLMPDFHYITLMISGIRVGVCLCVWMCVAAVLTFWL